MFGFGKKKLTDQLRLEIAFEICMLNSWTFDNRGAYLPHDDLRMIAQKILERKGLPAGEVEVEWIFIFMIEFESRDMLASAGAGIQDARQRAKFDAQVQTFCRNIGLPERYYTPKPG